MLTMPFGRRALLKSGLAAGLAVVGLADRALATGPVFPGFLDGFGPRVVPASAPSAIALSVVEVGR